MIRLPLFSPRKAAASFRDLRETTRDIIDLRHYSAREQASKEKLAGVQSKLEALRRPSGRQGYPKWLLDKARLKTMAAWHKRNIEKYGVRKVKAASSVSSWINDVEDNLMHLAKVTAKSRTQPTPEQSSLLTHLAKISYALQLFPDRKSWRVPASFFQHQVGFSKYAQNISPTIRFSPPAGVSDHASVNNAIRRGREEFRNYATVTYESFLDNLHQTLGDDLRHVIRPESGTEREFNPSQWVKEKKWIMDEHWKDVLKQAARKKARSGRPQTNGYAHSTYSE